MSVERSAFPPKVIDPCIIFSTKKTISITVVFYVMCSSGRPDTISKDGVESTCFHRFFLREFLVEVPSGSFINYSFNT
eukprot:6502000-Heterocapsa_arctica.AAC.1